MRKVELGGAGAQLLLPAGGGGELRLGLVVMGGARGQGHGTNGSVPDGSGGARGATTCDGDDAAKVRAAPNGFFPWRLTADELAPADMTMERRQREESGEMTYGTRIEKEKYYRGQFA